jgi:hypothetical protein
MIGSITHSFCAIIRCTREQIQHSQEWKDENEGLRKHENDERQPHSNCHAILTKGRCHSQEDQHHEDGSHRIRNLIQTCIADTTCELNSMMSRC